MKANKLIILMIAIIILSFNAIAAESLVWRTVDGKPSVQSFSALDNDMEYETEPSEIDSIRMIDFKDEIGGNSILCVNCPEINKDKEFAELNCKDKSCTLYFGFKNQKQSLEQYKRVHYSEIPDYNISLVGNYEAGHPLIDVSGNKIEIQSLDQDGSQDILDGTKNNIYKVFETHTIRLTNAKVTFDNQGNIKLIQGLNRDRLETAWIDHFGIPLTVNDAIDFSKDDSGNIDYSKPWLVINPDVRDKEKWIENLPDELKEDGRSKLKLCGYDFTNYYSDSDFKIEKTEDGCLLREYTLTTELFVEEDITNWQEFEYECGELNIFAMGGKLDHLKCMPKSSKFSVKDEVSDNQKFRMQQDSYWLSINEESGFKSVVKGHSDAIGDYGTSFKTKKLRVSHQIPGTGGPERYKGDLIETIGDEESFVTFVMPGDGNYKQVDGYIEPQIHVDSIKMNEIYRKTKGTEYRYSFQEPHKDYVLQLGNDLRRDPIVAIFPAIYDLDSSEVREIIMYDGHDILTYGVSVQQGLNLGAGDVQLYVLQYDPDYKAKKEKSKVEESKENVEENILITHYVADKCYGKEYDELNSKQKDNVYRTSLKLRQRNPGAFGKLQDLPENQVSASINPGQEITFPGSETTYKNKQGNEVKIRVGPEGCPGLAKRNIVKAINNKKPCINVNGKPGALCMEKEECEDPIQLLPDANYKMNQGNVGSRAQTLSMETSGQCDDGLVCCRLDRIMPKVKYEKKSKLPTKRKSLGDKPCERINGECGHNTIYSCQEGKWISNKCLSNPDRNYLCCNGNLVKKRSKGVEWLTQMINLFYPDDVPPSPKVSEECKIECKEQKNNKDCIELGSKKKGEECNHYCNWITSEESKCVRVESEEE